MDNQEEENKSGSRGVKMIKLIITTIVVFLFILFIFGRTNGAISGTSEINIMPGLYTIISIALIILVIILVRRHYNNLVEEKRQNIKNVWLIVLKVTVIDGIMGLIWFWGMAGIAVGSAFGGGGDLNLILYSSLAIVLAVHTFFAIKFWKRKFQNSPNQIGSFLKIFLVPLIVVVVFGIILLR